MVDPRRARARGLGTCFAAVLLVSSGGGARVLAGELAYGAGYSFTYDSNPTLVATNPTSDQIHEALAGFAYRESTGTVNARLLAQAEARSYRHDTFGDDSFLFLDGAAVWSIVPKTLDWAVEDTRRETRIDLTVADTPANRATTNAFSTGPDFTLRLGSATTLGLGARYGRFEIEDAGGNRRSTGFARLQYLLSGASKLTANYESTRIRVEPPSVFSETRREDLFARYEARTSAANQVALDVGATRIAPEGGEDLSRRRMQLSIGRQLTPVSGIRASLADYVSDTFTDSLTQDALVLAPPASIDVYRARKGGMNYHGASGPLGYSLQGHAQRVDYETLDNDYKEKGGRFELTWQHSFDLRLHASTALLRRRFPGLGRTDDESTIAIGVTYMLTRNVRLVADAGYQETDSTLNPEAIVGRRVRLFLAYSSSPPFTPQSRR